MKKDTRPLSFASMALALASDCNRLFVIDSDDDSYVEYSANGAEKELVPVSSGEDFFRAVHRDAREQVWPEDQTYGDEFAVILQDVFERAGKRMYEDKTKCKQKAQ